MCKCSASAIGFRRAVVAQCNRDRDRRCGGARLSTGGDCQTVQLDPNGASRPVRHHEVGGVPEVAEVLGISKSTARTHLKHLFEKTCTTRQAELVKLVVGYTRFQ
jgi:hypothetical protein